ncbi:formate/nitrite transporter family protein [Pyruvatibacter mobilis]|uniref:formate/nitrite transporter family protein n=1 Tax=Pyruvatibacter mobilis TaxID=1712261 RepID=UPI003BB076D5
MAESKSAGQEQETDEDVVLTSQQRVQARKNLRSSSPVIFETIRQEGIEELERPALSLWWSGIAAGLVMTFSLYTKGYLHLHLPDEAWRPLVSNFGYCLGFLLVIVGRLQLFTENTIKPVLPLFVTPTFWRLRTMLALWGIVFIANLVGVCASVFLVDNAGLAKPDQIAAFLEVSHHLADRSAVANIALGVPAGFLLAALVWGLADMESGRLLFIIAVTYVIALGEFSHVVAGSAEVALLTLHGDMGVGQAFTQFVFPTLLGNILGGTGLFALLAYGQVRHEIIEES